MELLISHGVSQNSLMSHNSFDYHQTSVPALREVRIYPVGMSE